MDKYKLLQHIHAQIGTHRIATGGVENVLLVLHPKDAKQLGSAVLGGLGVPHVEDKGVKRGAAELRPTGRFALRGMVQDFRVM